MSTMIREESIVFRRPFCLEGVEDIQWAGTYFVQIEEEIVESLSVYAVRRISTSILVPIHPGHAGSTQSMLVEQRDLEEAIRQDALPAPRTSVPNAGIPPR